MYKIDDPSNKIILIYNHEGWGAEKKWSGCLAVGKEEGTLALLSGTKIKVKELVVWVNRELWKAGKEPETKCATKHKYKGKSLGLTMTWYECLIDPPTYIKKIKGQNFVSNFPQFNRANITKEIADTFVINETPRNQIFISG